MKKRGSTAKNIFSLFQPLEARRFLSVTPAIDLLPDASSASVSGYSPSQVSVAYGFSGLSFSTGKVAANGAGQTIAIVDAFNDPNIAGDLKSFDSQFNLPTANLKVVNQTGGSTLPASNGGWAEEISLDVEWAHSIAPGANLLLVETNSSNTSDLLAGVNYARSASGVSVVSMSWGGSEFYGETSDDSYFTTPAGHTPVTFIAASGDQGSAGGVEWPASSPNVLSVGGTSLSTSSSSGTYSSETGWSDSTGGVSQYEGEPEYQNGVQSEYARTVPDVAADANPSTGVAVYDSYSYDGYSGWLEFGGTSAAAPQWAGLIAIADQGRVIGGHSTLDGTTNTLPTLYNLQGNSSTYSSDFHDITSGSTSRSISAGTGYDLVTGIGSPKASKLIPALVASTTSTPLTITTEQFVPPPRFYWFGGFFVATSGGTFAGTLSTANDSTSFTTSINHVSPLAVQQSLFDSSLPTAAIGNSLTANGLDHLAAITSGAITGKAITGSAITGSAITGSAITTAAADNAQLSLQSATQAFSPVTAFGSGMSSAAAQAVERELAEVSQYAQQMVAQLGRDLAIDFGHLEGDGDTLLGAIAGSSAEVRTLTSATLATVIAISVLNSESGEKKTEQPSMFSSRMIELA